MHGVAARTSRIFMGVFCLICPAIAFGSDLAILTEKTWDEFVPRGKEVDAIYGDFVLRNDRIVVVVANPIQGRNANMTVKDVGGSIIDLTLRGHENDQLSAFYPGARRFPYRLASIGAEGNVSLDAPASINKDAVAFQATDGKLQTRANVLKGDVVQMQLVSPGSASLPEVRLAYTLRNGAPAVEVRSEYRNTSDKPIKITLVDDFRADRTFSTAAAGPLPLVWFYDKGWRQAYGVIATGKSMRLTGSPVDPRVIEYLEKDQPTVELAPGENTEVVRMIFPGENLVAVKATAAELTSGEPLVPVEIAVKDSKGQPVPHAEVQIQSQGDVYGHAAASSDGIIQLRLPAGTYDCSVSALGRGSSELKIEAAGGRGKNARAYNVELPVAARVVAQITDDSGGPIACKVQFIGTNGTPSPFFFDDTGEHAVRNLYYTHNGRFTQEIAPGKYEVLISRGPEYDAEKILIEAKRGTDTPLRATLKRVVQSPGWISTDFHSHSSPSGDNVSSQLGRVLNLVCEHIEFAPCTEHNRLDTYVPHLKALGIEHLMGTCTGIELTGSPGLINHQNAFPLRLKPRVQDNGAPLTDVNPDEQIKRLALWDDEAEKLVQSNHPDFGEMFFDRDGDGKPDSGYLGMFTYQDVIEVHPIHDVLQFNPLRYSDVENRQTKVKTKYQYNNTIFNWLQLINQGRRLPGVINTDAHYNFHGSGHIRNYVKCETDDPSKIDPMDIVRASEKGHIILSNGPYLEVALYDSAASNAGLLTERRKAIPGDDIALPGGVATLHVRVQCPNWFDIDTVQVLLNGRPEKTYGWTRSANGEAFSDGVVKFDRKIPIEFKSDAHVIVVAAGEKGQIGPVMGPEHGPRRPTAISNPIFVDADGGGFKANGDTLGHPLPVKQQQPVPPVTK